MSQFPWGAPLQLPMEVDSSAGGWSWQYQLMYPQITLPQQQDSIDPLGADEEELISRLRSGPLLSPPRSPLTSDSASQDIWVTLWDPYTWIPPCSLQIDHAYAAFCRRLQRANECLKMIHECIESLRSRLSGLSGPNELVEQQFKFRKDGELKSCIHFNKVFPFPYSCFLPSPSWLIEMERQLRRPKCSVRIQYLNEDDDDDGDNRYDALTVEAHLLNPYGPNELLKQQFKFTKDGELQYCIHCNKVFPSGARLSDLKKHLILSHRLLFELFRLLFELRSRVRVDNGRAAASIDAVQHWFFEEQAGASNSRGLCEGYQNALEAARGNEKPTEIDSQKSASRHVEFPLAFDQLNTPPERMPVDNGKAAASTDALWIDAVQNCFEETTKADKPKGTWSAVWEHFVKIKIDDTEWADCKYCKKRFAGGSKEAGTSTLRRHLDKLHGIKIPKASSSKNKNPCGGPATSKSKTPTPSLLLPSLEPVASKPPRTTTQRKKRTDEANDLATQEVCARGKRTRRRDNPSSSGVTPSEVPGSASTVGHATEMAVASSQIVLSAAGTSREVVRSIADTITNPGPTDLASAILLMNQAAEGEKMLLQEMEKLRQEKADQDTAVISRLEALEAKSALAADENKKLKAENTALRAQLQESPHSRPSKRS